MSDLLQPDIYTLSEKISLYIFDIKDLSVPLSQFMDSIFVDICEGNSGNTLEDAKLAIKKLYEGKKDEWIIGATAEFFLHLFLRSQGLKQECLFCNLEEDSIKKGFDGYYSDETDTWIMESKAGLETSVGGAHHEKLRLAYYDLSKKLSGNDKSKNNPWKNAFNHARIVDSSLSIKEALKTLSNQFNQGIYQKIQDFNVIPCATVFKNGISEYKDHLEIMNNVDSIKNLFNATKIKLICVTQESVSLFLQYIGA